MEATATTLPIHEDRKQTVQRIAGEMFQKTPDWVTFFREVLGVGGLVRRLFTTPDELAEFEKTAEYAEIKAMVTRLRERTGAPAESTKETTRVITVRLPSSLHESLKCEANERNTSINQLCISKLLQVLENGEEG